MAEKDYDKRASKLKRKLSKKHDFKEPAPAFDSTENARSATLPLPSDQTLLTLNQSQSEGLFSKLRRRLHLGSKGKYDFNLSGMTSPSKPRWLRRKSDETQIQPSNRNSGVEQNQIPVCKSSSVKTSRKAQPHKEEVILIRKDKRVSVICKSDNGAPEVIFSNVDNSDDDSSGAWGGIEEDPYTTISSVQEEIMQNNFSTHGDIKMDPFISFQQGKGTSKPGNTLRDAEEYPYAKIDLSKKCKSATGFATPQDDTNDAFVFRSAMMHNDPDYESLDEVKQQKSLLEMNKSVPELSHLCSKPKQDFDPDYETLEEIKEKCVNARHLSCHTRTPHVNRTLSACEDFYTGPKKLLFHSDGDNYFLADFSEENKRQSPKSDPISVSQSRPDFMGSPQLMKNSTSISSSHISPTTLAPLAPSVDSSLPHDRNACQKFSLHEKDNLYDNPNVILRKQVLRTSCSAYNRRNHTQSEPVSIKTSTPAEEELVEKLSALLAPPLPLRNYQKDEVYPPKGEKIIRNYGGNVRHSWSSQPSKYVDSPEELSFLKENERGQSLSVGHSKENLSLKIVRDSFLTKVQEHHEAHSRKAATEHSKVKGKSAKEAFTDKVIDKGTVLNNTSNDMVVVSGKESFTENLHRPEESVSSKAHKHEPNNTSSSSTKSEHMAISDFCQHLATKIVQEVISQETSKTGANEDQNIYSTTSPEKLSSSSGNGDIEAYSTDIPCISKEPVSSHIEKARQIDGKAHSNIFSSDVSFINCIQRGVESNASVKSSVRLSVSHNLGDSNDVKNAEQYKLQGARPKFKPLFLKQRCLFPLEYENNDTMNNAILKSSPLSQSSESCVTDLHSIDEEALSPSFPGVDFHTDVEEGIPFPESKRNEDKEGRKFIPRNWNKGEKREAGYNLQETVFVDSESEEISGQRLHSSIVVHAKADLCIRKIFKPIFYANPRLLENVISGRFKKEPSLDNCYLQNGVWKWARYFPEVRNKQVIEEKLKRLFWFIYDMLISSPSVREKKLMVQNLQYEMDCWQSKIEKHLKDVQRLPTFKDVRLKLLSSSNIDDWEPEKPKLEFTAAYSGSKTSGGNGENPRQELSKEESWGSLTNVVNDVSEAFGNVQKVNAPAREDLHSDEILSDNPEGFCDLGSNMGSQTFPVDAQAVLDEFMRASEYPLRCKLCIADDESDSEDELVTLETYAKTVSGSCERGTSNKINYINNVSFCRALHGELAYSTRHRKSRAQKKMLLVPGPNEQCKGPKSHLSWKEWVTADSLFKNLVPHISPRLDFQFLLKTYAEFKFFILKDRKRDFDHRGCFLREFPRNELHCCRFEEFVFLKIIAEELRHIASVISTSKVAKALFLEEWDIAFSLLKLMKLVVRNIHKMQKSMSRELVHTGENHMASDMSEFKVMFRHTQFRHWLLDQKSCLVPTTDYSIVRRFHLENYESFRADTFSKVLKDWKAPEDFLEDPNVLATFRTVFAHTDSRSIELAGMRGPEGDPKPLQEREDFLESMEQLQLKEWYWGPISYEQAAHILKDKEDGSFLVRDSSDQKYLLSLSFKSLGEVHHTRIEHAKGLFSFWSQPESHGKARICEFIEKSVQNSRDGRFLYFLRPSGRGTPPLPIRLLNPVSRSFRVATLKHLSRFVVRQTVRKDHLDLLPVPEKVKRYLRDKQYYAEILDEDDWALDGD